MFFVYVVVVCIVVVGLVIAVNKNKITCLGSGLCFGWTHFTSFLYSSILSLLSFNPSFILLFVFSPSLHDFLSRRFCFLRNIFPALT